MDWALNNQTYTHMNSWFHYAKLYAATAGCIGFMMLKYKWSIGGTEWFKVFPFVIVAINILIAVVSDFESGIKGLAALRAYGDRWWLSSENVWLYGGWWNWAYRPRTPALSHRVQFSVFPGRQKISKRFCKLL